MGGVLLSVKGGEFQVPQVAGTLSFIMDPLKNTVKPPPEIKDKLAPSLNPLMSISVVEDV